MSPPNPFARPPPSWRRSSHALVRTRSPSPAITPDTGSTVNVSRGCRQELSELGGAALIGAVEWWAEGDRLGPARALEPGADGGDGAGTGERPDHARLLKARGDDLLAAAFHRA